MVNSGILVIYHSLNTGVVKLNIEFGVLSKKQHYQIYAINDFYNGVIILI